MAASAKTKPIQNDLPCSLKTITMAMLVLTIVLALQLRVAASASTCFATQSSFVTMCKNTLHGVVDGARCYFPVKTAGTWNDAWAVCRSYGAVVAQLHTLREYTAVDNFILAVSLAFDFWNPFNMF